MSPTLPAESARDSQGILPGLRLILAAATLPACHAAIAATAGLLEDLFGFSIEAAEIMPAPGQAAILWRSGERYAPTDLAAWFARAKTHQGRCLTIGDSAGLAMASHEPGAPFIALFADIMTPPPLLESAMRDVADFAARQLARLRHETQLRAQRQRLEEDDSRHALLLRAHADLVWDANAEGVVHVTEIFNGRCDLAHALDGLALQKLGAAGEKLLAGKTLRAEPVTLPGLKEPLYISGVRRDASFLGIAAAASDLRAERLAVDVRTLETILAGRSREEQLRRETETMMVGLRLLLSDISFRERLEQLAAHLAAAIGCDEVRLVLLRPGEKPRLIIPEQPSPRPAMLEMIAGIGEARSVTVLPAQAPENIRLSHGLGMNPGEILILALPTESECYYLLCRSRRLLSQADQGVAERVSLLLRQALALQADQQRMAHTAKLSALGQMSTSIAHELRQPLNAISIAAQNIELMTELGKLSPEMLKEKTARILAQIERASKVMDRMRRFGRKAQGEHKPVPLAGLALSARSLMDGAILGVGVEVDVPEGLSVMADELEIEQVLVNLIQNAADAIGEKKPGKIRIWSQEDPGDKGLLRLHVEDNGPGFAPEVEKHALDAFFTTKPEGKGTGLGLSIAHAILREHGGRLLIGNGALGGARISLVLRRPGAQVIAFTPRAAEAS